jgi:hypothetical protein
MARRRRIEELTRRWQERREERRRTQSRSGVPREAADPVRSARAASAFPFRRVTPADYIARHGADMVGFTYDDYTYADAALQAWLDEVGRLLRLMSDRPGGGGKTPDAAEPPDTAETPDAAEPPDTAETPDGSEAQKT